MVMSNSVPKYSAALRLSLTDLTRNGISLATTPPMDIEMIGLGTWIIYIWKLKMGVPKLALQVASQEVKLKGIRECL